MKETIKKICNIEKIDNFFKPLNVLIPLSNIDGCVEKLKNHSGVYQIIHFTSGQFKTIYIGETGRNFYERLIESSNKNIPAHMEFVNNKELIFDYAAKRKAEGRAFEKFYPISQRFNFIRDNIKEIFVQLFPTDDYNENVRKSLESYMIHINNPLYNIALNNKEDNVLYVCDWAKSVRVLKLFIDKKEARCVNKQINCKINNKNKKDIEKNYEDEFRLEKITTCADATKHNVVYISDFYEDKIKVSINKSIYDKMYRSETFKQLCLRIVRKEDTRDYYYVSSNDYDEFIAFLISLEKSYLIVTTDSIITYKDQNQEQNQEKENIFLKKMDDIEFKYLKRKLTKYEK